MTMVAILRHGGTCGPCVEQSSFSLAYSMHQSGTGTRHIYAFEHKIDTVTYILCVMEQVILISVCIDNYTSML